MTGDAPPARTGLSLCHRVILDSVAHWWVLARTPTVHQCLYGGRPWVAQDTLHATPPKRQDHGLQRHALVTNMFAEPVCCNRAWGQEQFTSPPPIQEGSNRKSGSSTPSRILNSTRHAANAHVQQVVNTVEVKTPKKSSRRRCRETRWIQTTINLAKINQVIKQVEILEIQYSAEADHQSFENRAASLEHAKTSRSLWIQLRTVVGMHDQHDQHDVHTVMMEHPKIIKNTVKNKNPIIQEKSIRCDAKPSSQHSSKNRGRAIEWKMSLSALKDRPARTQTDRVVGSAPPLGPSWYTFSSSSKDYTAELPVSPSTGSLHLHSVLEDLIPAKYCSQRPFLVRMHKAQHDQRPGKITGRSHHGVLRLDMLVHLPQSFQVVSGSA